MSQVLLDQPSRFHHAELQRHLTHCGDCGRLSYENQVACRRCGGQSSQQVSPVGEIYSYTTVYDDGGNFVLALVQLSGGPRVTAQIVGVDRELKIGLPVRFTPAAQHSSGAGPGGLCFSPLETNSVIRQ